MSYGNVGQIGTCPVVVHETSGVCLTSARRTELVVVLIFKWEKGVDKVIDPSAPDDIAVMLFTELQNPPSSTTEISVANMEVTSGKYSSTGPSKLTPTIVVDGFILDVADTTDW